MNSTLAVFLLALGEGLSIAAELLAVRHRSALLGMLAILPTVPLLIYGYLLGAKEASVWVVGVTSATLILLIEPMLCWSLFREPPSRGAVAGFACAGLGMFLAYWWK